MKPLHYLSLSLLGLMLTQCAPKETGVSFQFDGSQEVSGMKFALKDINPELPANWDDYNFVILEYKITSAQRFQVGFTTDEGYNEVNIHSYVPNGWNQLVIPLVYYREQAGAAIDLAATYNHPRYTGWINIDGGGHRGPLHGVDSIGVRMVKPVGTPTIQIRNITLAVEDPGDRYLEETPAYDEFGQNNLIDYEGKAHSLEELQADWKAEDDEVVTTEPYNYSQYGGYKQKQVEATGYFRTTKMDDRWWFVDPEGYLFLSLGVDCVSAGGGGGVRDIEKRDGMFKQLPPDSVMATIPEGRQRSNKISFGIWNQYRRYGVDYPVKSKDLIVKRMDKWGLNTIANWSDRSVIELNRKAFLLQFYSLGLAGDLMGLADVYAPDFRKMEEEGIRQLTDKFATDPWLIGYFLGNEPAWLNREDQLCSLILEGKDRPIKAALKEYIAKNGDTPENRKTFIIDSFKQFLTISKELIKKNDPHHLILGIRFGNPMKVDRRILDACAANFDVLSFNCYSIAPDKTMMDQALEATGLPMIIGEYHFGTVDHGQAQSLIKVDSQHERGVAFRYYTEQAYAHPGIIGTAYFQWCDQDMTGRMDGENYNCGFIDVTDRPYKEQVEAISATAKALYDVHSGAIPPFSEYPANARSASTSAAW